MGKTIIIILILLSGLIYFRGCENLAADMENAKIVVEDLQDSISRVSLNSELDNGFPGNNSYELCSATWIESIQLWNCIGEGRVGEVCVMNPVHEIPLSDFNNILGEQPVCVSITNLISPANWKDTSNGEGYDELICTGTCAMDKEIKEIIKTDTKWCGCVED